MYNLPSVVQSVDDGVTVTLTLLEPLVLSFGGINHMWGCLARRVCSMTCGTVCFAPPAK